jgi:hypothetical protein
MTRAARGRGSGLPSRSPRRARFPGRVGHDLTGRRSAPDGVKVPLRRFARAMLKNGLPHLLLEPGGSNQVEVIRDIHAAHEAAHALPFVVEGEESRERSRVVGDAKEVQRPPAEEGARPGRLPLPGEEDRRMAGASEEGVPAFLVERFEARKRLNLHRRSRRPSGWSRSRRSRPRRSHPCPPRRPPTPRPWPRPGRLPGPPPSPRPCA